MAVLMTFASMSMSLGTVFMAVVVSMAVVKVMPLAVMQSTAMAVVVPIRMLMVCLDRSAKGG